MTFGDDGEIGRRTGWNGCGKSTLLAGISNELSLASGEILIDGTPLSDWPLQALAQRRAVLLQDSDLSFPFTVLDVVLMGRSAFNSGVVLRPWTVLSFGSMTCFCHYVTQT